MLRDGVEDVDLVLADQLGPVRDLGVEIALLDVELLRRLQALPRLLGIEDGVRPHLERALDLLALHLLGALHLDGAHERSFLHPEGDHHLVPLHGLEIGVHLVEEAHGVHGAHVAVERLLIEGLAGLRAEVDSNGVLLDAQVPGDAHASDRPLTLRGERGGGDDDPHHDGTGDEPSHGAVADHDAPPPALPRRVSGAAGGACRSSLRRP